MDLGKRLDIGGIEKMPTEYNTFIAYVTRRGKVELLGPVRETEEEIKEVVDKYKSQGWENKEKGLHVTWVQIGSHGPWIIT